MQYLKHINLKYKAKQTKSNIQAQFIHKPQMADPEYQNYREKVKLLNRAKYLEKQMIIRERNQQINKVFATLESY